MQFVVFTDKRLKFHLICCMLKALDQMNWEDCYQTSGKESALQFGHVYYCDVSDLSLPLLTVKVYEIWQMQVNSWVSTYTAFFLSSGMEFHFCSSWLSSRKWETANKIFAMRIFFLTKLCIFLGKNHVSGKFPAPDSSRYSYECIFHDFLSSLLHQYFSMGCFQLPIPNSVMWDS